MGYRWSALLFIAAALALTADLWIEQPVRSSLGVLVILAGVPFYFYKSAQHPLAALE
jgi:uncharacterized membrane protein